MKFLNRFMAVSLATLAMAGAWAAAPLLERVSTIPMPGVKGRIDHFSANPKDHRIFVAALGNDTVEVLDTERRQRRSIPGLGEPQGVLYLADSNRLFVANGGVTTPSLERCSWVMARARFGSSIRRAANPVATFPCPAIPSLSSSSRAAIGYS
jgi:YVTN family beta-propeller protein